MRLSKSRFVIPPKAGIRLLGSLKHGLRSVGIPAFAGIPNSSIQRLLCIKSLIINVFLSMLTFI